jgi:hypothetical protein
MLTHARIDSGVGGGVFPFWNSWRALFSAASPAGVHLYLSRKPIESAAAKMLEFLANADSNVTARFWRQARQRLEGAGVSPALHVAAARRVQRRCGRQIPHLHFRQERVLRCECESRTVRSLGRIRGAGGQRHHAGVRLGRIGQHQGADHASAG